MQKPFLFVLLLAATAMCSAQGFEVHAGGGFTKPTGDMTPRFDTSGHFLLGGGFNFLPKAEIQAEYMYNAFGMSNAFAFANGARSGSAHVNSVTIDPLVRLRLPGTRFGVQGEVGLGYYRRTIVFNQPNVDLHNGAFGYNLGGGVFYKLTGPADLFFDIRYHDAATGRGHTQMVPFTFGVRF